MPTKTFDQLRPLFAPRSIAIIGASRTRGKWGHDMVQRPIQSSFRGSIYPINPKGGEIEGLRAYPSVLDVDESVDLAVITIPAPLVPGAVRDCARKGIKAIVLITAGFAETGPKGRALQDEVVDIARSAGIRFMGPNGMGIWSSEVRLNCAFDFTPQSGGISFISQSGTMGGYLLATANDKGYGFNAFLSVGNQADLEMADYVEYLRDDKRTKVIVLYVEGLKDGKRFLQSARAATAKKPIIVFKAGRTEDGSRAALSHTASLAGSDEIFDAACRQAGIIRTRDVIHAFDIAEALSKQPLPGGNRVGIVSGGGGECVCCTDACNGFELEVPELNDEVVDALSAHLLPHASRPKNPIDLAADPRHMTVAQIAEFLARQPEIDAIIARAPTWGIEPSTVKEALGAAEIISRIPERYGKPVIATALRRERNGVVYELMRERNIPTYEFPEEAARAIYGLYSYSKILKRAELAAP